MAAMAILAALEWAAFAFLRTRLGGSDSDLPPGHGAARDPAERDWSRPYPSDVRPVRSLTVHPVVAGITGGAYTP